MLNPAATPSRIRDSKSKSKMNSQINCSQIANLPRNTANDSSDEPVVLPTENVPQYNFTAGWCCIASECNFDDVGCYFGALTLAFGMVFRFSSKYEGIARYDLTAARWYLFKRSR